jgi:hypothetical protein
VHSLRKTHPRWANHPRLSQPAPARPSARVPIIAACHRVRALLVPAIPCPA